MSQSHVTHPHGIHQPQSSERTADRMSSFDTDQAPDSSSTESALDAYYYKSYNFWSKIPLPIRIFLP